MKDARERAEAVLADRYAADVIDADELERRLDTLQAAQGLAAIEAITADLAAPPGSAEALVPAGTPPVTALARPDQIEATHDIVSILSEQKQVGAWVPAHVNRIITVLGDSTIDLREAALGPGTTRLVIRCILGEVKILIPPGLDVHVETNAILASVELPEREEIARRGPNDPRIVLSGLVVLGSVEVYERLPGESKREAKRRRKKRRKELAEARKRRALSG